jgi:hypothetical protein
MAAVSRLLAGERVSVQALMLERNGTLRLLPDNHLRAAVVLRAHRHQVTERDVLAADVADAAGAIAPILGLLGERGVNVEYAYGGAATRGSALIVLGVDDAARAALVSGL